MHPARHLIEAVEELFPAIQREFDRYQLAFFPARTPEFFCLELCGEAGELANLEKKRWKGKDIDDNRIADEAADVFIALCNYANARGVNLAAAVGDKLRHIEARRRELVLQGEEF
jgi:NTP pyrophosphatase (non-canonical NTP hydrolase)